MLRNERHSEAKIEDVPTRMSVYSIRWEASAFAALRYLNRSKRLVLSKAFGSTLIRSKSWYRVRLLASMPWKDILEMLTSSVEEPQPWCSTTCRDHRVVRSEWSEWLVPYDSSQLPAKDSYWCILGLHRMPKLRPIWSYIYLQSSRCQEASGYPRGYRRESVVHLVWNGCASNATLRTGSQTTHKAYIAQRKFLNSETWSPTKQIGLSSELPSLATSPWGKVNIVENEEPSRDKIERCTCV